mmetsp:Transcript_29/g.35  ORF Transcript_29/g.35 Transcript_29/m.35 type:complete len:148 (-) Transcript_29:101-544(-)
MQPYNQEHRSWRLCRSPTRGPCFSVTDSSVTGAETGEDGNPNKKKRANSVSSHTQPNDAEPASSRQVVPAPNPPKGTPAPGSASTSAKPDAGRVPGGPEVPVPQVDAVKDPEPKATAEGGGDPRQSPPKPGNQPLGTGIRIRPKFAM